MPSCIALIPARAGSTRVTDKNIRPLAGHPLMAYTIAAAETSGIFTAIVVATDSEAYAAIAQHYGAETPFLRPADISGATSPDIEWVTFTLQRLQAAGQTCDCFSILRPTSPFRQPETIQRAWREFLAEPGVDSLRAVEKCSQHPGKMWVINGKKMNPLLPFQTADQPWHSHPYQALPDIYVQNASLELAWTRVVQETHTISGHVIMPFFTHDFEGFDVNNLYDWHVAEELVRTGQTSLPIISAKPYAP